jgi:hypothetical protein
MSELAIDHGTAASSEAGATSYLTALNEAQAQAVAAVDGPVLVLGRRRHRQDAGADDAPRAYPRISPGFPRRDAGGHLYQQGGARDARAPGGDDRSRCRGRLARHVPRARRAHPAPSCRGGRAQIELHDPRHRRPAAPRKQQILAAAHIDERRWPARALHAVIERWKDRGLTPDKVSASEIGDFADGKAIDLYRLYQERLATVNAVDFGDLLLHNLTLFQSNPDILGHISTASAMCWSTSTRTPTSRNICGCGCSRSSTRTSAASATTTSRSTRGAARRSRTSSNSRAISPAR